MFFIKKMKRDNDKLMNINYYKMKTDAFFRDEFMNKLIPKIYINLINFKLHKILKDLHKSNIDFIKTNK